VPDSEILVPDPAPEPPPVIDPIDPVDPPDDPAPEPEPTATGEPDSAPAAPGDPVVTGDTLGPVSLQPMEPDAVVLSVLSDRPQSTVDSGPVVKPTVETAQTFLQELKSFWTDDTPGGVDVDDVPHGQGFWQDLDNMATDLDNAGEESQKRLELNAEAAAGVGITLTAGFVSWVLRAGSLVASFLAAMPAWRQFDPMPILAADEKSQREFSAGADADEAERAKRAKEEAEARIDDLFEQ
jgi:hypothetical protein